MSPGRCRASGLAQVVPCQAGGLGPGATVVEVVRGGVDVEEHERDVARVPGVEGDLGGLVVAAGLAGAPPSAHALLPGPDKPASPKDANRAPTPSCALPAERANAQPKTWRILRKLRCYPWHAEQLAKAIHVLQAREIAR